MDFGRSRNDYCWSTAYNLAVSFKEAPQVKQEINGESPPVTSGIVREVSSCRVCGCSDLSHYLDLGMMPLANNLAASTDAAKAMRRFPMQVQYCPDCSLSQLTVVIDPREMFSNYAYRSSISQAYLVHCRAMAKSLNGSLGLGADDLVVDIAGNDGALLAVFKEELGVRVVNVDPAENLAVIAEAAGVTTITSFWGTTAAEQIVRDYGRPSLSPQPTYLHTLMMCEDLLQRRKTACAKTVR